MPGGLYVLLHLSHPILINYTHFTWQLIKSPRDGLTHPKMNQTMLMTFFARCLAQGEGLNKSHSACTYCISSGRNLTPNSQS